MGQVGFAGGAVALELVQLVRRQYAVPGAQHGLQFPPHLAPHVGPGQPRRLAGRRGSSAQDGQEGLVVDLYQLGPPEDAGRERRAHLVLDGGDQRG